MWHGHPIVAGYVTRTPERLWRVTTSDPVFSALFREPVGRPRPLGVTREDAIARLRLARIRYVIVDAASSEDPTGLSLPERYRGSRIAIFEVPGRATASIGASPVPGGGEDD
jgi:hypothetical protein